MYKLVPVDKSKLPKNREVSDNTDYTTIPTKPSGASRRGNWTGLAIDVEAAGETPGFVLAFTNDASDQRLVFGKAPLKVTLAADYQTHDRVQEQRNVSQEGQVVNLNAGNFAVRTGETPWEGVEPITLLPTIAQMGTLQRGLTNMVNEARVVRSLLHWLGDIMRTNLVVLDCCQISSILDGRP